MAFALKTSVLATVIDIDEASFAEKGCGLRTPGTFPGLCVLKPDFWRTLRAGNFTVHPGNETSRRSRASRCSYNDERVVSAGQQLDSEMHRVLFRVNPHRPVTALPQLQLLMLPRIYRRDLSFLNKGNKYLVKLLDDSGISDLKTPLKGLLNPRDELIPVEPGRNSTVIFFGSEQVLEADWMIDYKNVCISCSLKLANTADGLEKMDPIVIDVQYPEYSDNVDPPKIPALVESNSPRMERVTQFLNAMWRTFCVNDLLKLNVKASMDSRGKIEVTECDAIVDECAVQRQPEIFQHVARNDVPEEIEAEKSLLVYRKSLANFIQLMILG